ncbi:unnamed protein product [Symbiodinium natans]|uniref:Uncharacterized protein n=1 Tax=Symbiodinium natans TaxID=878477 RepID=A0A812PF92_9DINO|nr:unnamed protein product [Symbiodinium natans]
MPQAEKELEPRIEDLEKRLRGSGGAVQSDGSPRRRRELREAKEAKEAPESPSGTSLSEAASRCFHRGDAPVVPGEMALAARIAAMRSKLRDGPSTESWNEDSPVAGGLSLFLSGASSQGLTTRLGCLRPVPEGSESESKSPPLVPREGPEVWPSPREATTQALPQQLPKKGTLALHEPVAELRPSLESAGAGACAAVATEVAPEALSADYHQKICSKARGMSWVRGLGYW